jgi:hypothetical protein
MFLKSPDPKSSQCQTAQRGEGSSGLRVALFHAPTHCLAGAAALRWGMPRPQKITFGRNALLRRARSPDLLLGPPLQPFDRDQCRSWPDHVRLSGLEPRFVCQACGKRGVDVRPDFHWDKPPVAAMSYR